MARSIPERFSFVTTSLLHAAGISLFFAAFALLYDPFGLSQWYDMGRGRFTFNITILSCILLGSLLLTRTAFMLISSKRRFTMPYYCIWCVFEIVVAAHFLTLYSVLAAHGTVSYLSCLGYCLSYSFGIMVYPYLILTLVILLTNSMAPDESRDEGNLMRFKDENLRQKLVVNSDAVLYIESKENYVLVHYTDGEKVHIYQIRATMASLQELCEKHGIIRCQRSYYINPRHVKSLRKEADGIIFADLDRPGIRPVPVSKKYYDALSAKLF